MTMRTRNEIGEDVSKHNALVATGFESNAIKRLNVTIEVLLDIRELLANPGVQNDFGNAKDSLASLPAVRTNE